MKTYKVAIGSTQNMVAQIKAIRSLFGLGLKEAKDLRDHAAQFGETTIEYPYELNAQAFFEARAAGIEVTEITKTAPEPVTNNFVEINAEMVALLKIMERAVRTDNQGLHRTVVALMDQIFMEKQ